MVQKDPTQTDRQPEALRAQAGTELSMQGHSVHAGDRGGVLSSVLMKNVFLMLLLTQQDNILIFSELIPYTSKNFVFPVLKNKKVFWAGGPRALTTSPGP